MISKDQQDAVEKCIKELNWYIVFSHLVNRKGTDVVIMVCVKSCEIYQKTRPIVELIDTVF